MKNGLAKMLTDKRVLDEIDRYKWIESEKAGCDIGFEKASQDWLALYGEAWKKAHVKRRSGRSAKKLFK